MNKIRVLIAEDNDIIRENFVEVLSNDDDLAVIGSSSSGKGIIKLFEKFGADIILMDIEMETNDAGIVAAKKIFELSQDVKIIFLSVHENEDTIISAMATGAADYMIKSDDAASLIIHIKKAYNDKVEFERRIQSIMYNEFLRLSKLNADLITFTKKLALLTPTEKIIISYLLQDKKPAEIAELRCVELVTIKTQIGQLLKKFNVKRTKEITIQLKKLKLDQLFT